MPEKLLPSMTKRISLWIGVATLVLVIASSAAASASAATTPQPAQNTSNSSSLSARTGSSPDSEIVCTASLTTPSVSGSHAVTVSGVACTSDVTSISVLLDLVENGDLVAQTTGASFGSNTDTENLTKACSSPRKYHDWYAFALVTVNFPPGYSPGTESTTLTTPTARLLC